MFFGFSDRKNEFKLTNAHMKTLQHLIIDDTTPNTLLHDFQIMIDVFQKEAQKLTSTHQIRIKDVRAINERLSKPLDIRMKHQTQKSYPIIEGLYLLLRASGLTYVDQRGKTAYLRFSEDWLEQWNSLNPTEKYCYLLEVWILRADDEIIGGFSGSHMFGWNLQNILRGYREIGKKGIKIKSYAHLKDTFKYRPDLHHLGLMELFGMINIHHGDPIDGEGWQVKK